MKKVYIIIVLLSVFDSFLQGTEGCTSYSTSAENPERRKRQVDYNARNLVDTEDLRTYFTNCLTALEPDEGIDWPTTVDYSVLDTIWFDDNAVIYCGFGAEAEPCWMDNLGTYIKEDASIYPSVLKCIEYYVIDFTQTPPDTTRFPNVMPKRKKRFILESPELDLYSSCLTESTDPNIIDDRIQLNYTSLAEFVDLYTVNTSCFSTTVRKQIANSPLTWPRRIVSFTRADSPLRFSLHDCGEDVYPMVFPDRPLGLWDQWGGWSRCSEDCGIGTRTRSRECYIEGDNGNRILLSPLDCDCDSNTGTCAQQLELCNTSPCEPSGPTEWGPWIRISSCSASCGQGFQVEVRNCFRGSESVSFKLCEGVHTRIRACYYPPCPPQTMFAYGPWSSWGPCSVSCNQGVQYRMRCPQGFSSCMIPNQDVRSCVGSKTCN